MNERDYKVYSHLNKVNGKMYIGITRQADPNKRWLNGNGYKKNQHFWRAIEKYGWDQFEHSIIASGLTKEEACQMEIEMIKKYNTMDPKCGYNNTAGGEGVSGYVPTQEMRQKISERMKGEKNWNYGKPLSEEMKALLLAANVGSKHTEEHKKKIGDALRGRKHHTEEYKKSLSQKLKKPVRRSDGIIYPSINDAALANNVTKGAIIKALKTSQRSCGYYWEYCEKPNDYPERE